MPIIIIGAICFIMYCYHVGNPNNRYNSYEKPRKWLLKTRELFNELTNRLYKSAYPVSYYMKALKEAYDRGMPKLSDDELNFYLSYPTRFEFTKNFDIIVNGVNFGNANNCCLFDKLGSNFADKFNELLGDTFYVKNFVINTDYTGIMGEIDAKSGTEENCRDRLYKQTKKQYENIEKESTEFQESMKGLLSKEVIDVIDKMGTCEKSDDAKIYLDEFSKKAQETYFKAHPEYAEKFKKEYDIKAKDEFTTYNNVYNKFYDSFTLETCKSRTIEICALDDDNVATISNIDTNDKSISVSADTTKVLKTSDMCYSNETLENRYANILKDIELRYDMNEKEITNS